jgi:hypothetical protein
MTRFLHSAFGLTIASDLQLTELPAGEGIADVEVTLEAFPDSPSPSDSTVIVAAPNDVRGWMPTAGAFRVAGGREIVVDPIPGADERSLRLVIVGPLLGVILAQRGSFVLHASTVAIDGNAVAFFGPSGRGKSTLSAALTSRGHPLIADDMTVIDTRGDLPAVQPGFPRVKLWPDSAEALSHDAEALPLIHPDRTKRSLSLADRFNPDPLPLVRCFLLEDGEEEAVLELSPTEAILALVKCTYQSNWLQDTGASGANLLQCGELVRSGVVRRLQRRRSFDALPDVIRFIEEDVRSRAVRTDARA